MKASDVRIKFDTILDYVPFISTVNNAIDLVEKLALDIFVKIQEKRGKTKEEVLKNKTFCNYLNNKPYRECVGLLIPGANILIADARSRRNKFLKEHVEEIRQPSISPTKRNLLNTYESVWREFLKLPEWTNSDIQDFDLWIDGLSLFCLEDLPSEVAAKHTETAQFLIKNVSNLHGELAAYKEVPTPERREKIVALGESIGRDIKEILKD